jgi:hypothetical protein
MSVNNVPLEPALVSRTFLPAEFGRWQT